MRIIVLEKDWHERQLLVEALSNRFPNNTIVQLCNAREILLCMHQFVQDNTIIVMEHFLPLLEPNRDWANQIAELKQKFPEVATDWDHQQAAERLIRHMRQIGLNIPVIIQ